jgi:hypothetical protein
VTTVAVRKAVSITYSECVSVALVVQHAKRICPIILPSVASPALLYFCTLSHIHKIFGKKFTEYKMCLDFPATSVWNSSHAEKNSARYYHKCTQVSIHVIHAILVRL